MILEFFVPELEEGLTESEEIAYEKKKLHFFACEKVRKDGELLKSESKFD